MPMFKRREYGDTDDIEFDDDPEETVNHLSDILGVMEHIEALMVDLVNQGDKVVENTSRMVAVFERLEKEARNAG